MALRKTLLYDDGSEIRTHTFLYSPFFLGILDTLATNWRLSTFYSTERVLTMDYNDRHSYKQLREAYLQNP